jgi:pimeloyl-ACP methyl ester carboxylesterase
MSVVVMDILDALACRRFGGVTMIASTSIELVRVDSIVRETTLVLLPGLLCDRAAFEPLSPILAPHARCVVAEYASEPSIEAMAAKALAVAPPRFALLGHSMGGRVALEIVRRMPQRVERLALLDTGYQPRAAGETGEPERVQRMALLDLARREGMRAMGTRWVQPMVHPDRRVDRELIDAILAMIERCTADQFAAQIGALLARPDATDVLARIDCPTLVLCGRDDGWSPLARHAELQRCIRGSSLAVIDRCGHMAPMERPEAVAREIVAWLEK